MALITTCAEIGGNHMRDYEAALRLMEAAARSGAQHVKFQAFIPDRLDSRPDRIARLRQCQLPLEWLPQLRTYAHRLHLRLGVSVFDPEMVPQLKGVIDFVKISAYDITFEDLVRAAAHLCIPMMLSTAMATWDEISLADEWVIDEWTDTDGDYLWSARDGDEMLTLLHGVASYPAKLQWCNLQAIRRMSEFYVIPVGLSDHTLGYDAAMMAVAHGAEYIEKHFRLVSTPQSSPDFAHSADPEEFALMAAKAQVAASAQGNGWKGGPEPWEQTLFDTCRRTNQKRLRGDNAKEPRNGTQSITGSEYTAGAGVQDESYSEGGHGRQRSLSVSM